MGALAGLASMNMPHLSQRGYHHLRVAKTVSLRLSQALGDSLCFGKSYTVLFSSVQKAPSSSMCLSSVFFFPVSPLLPTLHTSH